ncbi:MAG: aldo/keto reductase, partial [Candidatus Kariarchaeaceae archaeon]
MQHVQLGTTGMQVSPICLGTMQFGWSADKETSFAIMNAAWDAGINFFDTADIYSRWAENSYTHKSEEIIGEWLKMSGNRDELILATKVRGVTDVTKINNQGLSRRHIMKQIEGSLKSLQTDYVDLYQSHSFDPSVPILSTLQTFTDLISMGKVRSIGASNYPSWKLMEAELTSQRYGLARYETLQPPYSLARRHRFEPELMDLCQQYNIAVIPYSPLSAGFLTGKYTRDGELPTSDRSSGVESRYFN